MKVPITTGREYHDFLRSRSAALIAALLLFTVSLHAESLWDSDFEGYVADGVALQIGDIISVTVTPHTTLSLASSHVDSQEGRLSFTGGEGQSLFSFLPQGSSSLSKEIEEESSYALETEIPVQITGRDENGLLILEGSRTVQLNNNNETLRISGLCAAESVTSERAIGFNDLYNAVLEYTSPGMQAEEIISAADISAREIADAEQADAQVTAGAVGTAEQAEGGVPAEAAAGEEGAAAAEQPAGAPTETPAGNGAGSEQPQSAQATAPVYQLSAEKQRELLLQYFNRFIDTLFEPAE